MIIKFIKNIIDQEKRILSTEERIKSLENINNLLSKEIEKLLSKSTPEIVVENVLGRNIKWFDYEDLDKTGRILYYEDAQAALRNRTLSNEINHLLSDTIEFIAKDTTNFEEVDRSRRVIVAIELLKERLEGIFDPRANDKELEQSAE